MKLTHYLYIAPLIFLTACSNEELPIAEELHPNGAIEVSADIVESGQQVMTRAGAEDHHTTPGHLNLTNGTKLALQVSGIWTGHSPSTSIVQTTTATVGAETSSGSKHNAVTCNPLLYWDDYGSAAEGNYDPNNKTAASNGAGVDYGRGIGLTIYGAAVNGKDTIPTISAAQWTSGLPWAVAANQTTTNWQPADKDLLISNNVKAGTGDGTYKFDQRASGKLLEFTHALSKITINLKAGAGFADSDNDGTNEFTNIPTVTLTSNEANTSTYTNWPYTRGMVNITTGTVTNQGNNAVITMNDAATNTTMAASGYTVTKEALVIPGSAFEGKLSADPDAEYHIIARINADGNIYYVTSEKIRQAIDYSTYASTTPFATEAGKNYVFNVIVNKTNIVVTATVTDWVTVTAAEVDPVINVSANWGNTTGNRSDAFSFYRSTDLNQNYSNGLAVGSYYPSESTVSYNSTTSKWEMSTSLYWPNHNTHYQFRGVLPQTGTGSGTVTYPRVEDGTGATSGYQVIKVQNAAYVSGTFPSDLQIARPEFDNPLTTDVDENTTTQCTNNEPGHSRTNLWSGGICATEGTINLKFRYMMSQVEVNLSTTNGSDAVNLSGAVVEIVNVYTTGDVKLGDRSVVPTGSTSSYTLNTVTGSGNENKRWSAIVPQELTYSTPQAATNVRFRITITNANNSTDVYYADVAPIQKPGGTLLNPDYVATHVTSPSEKWYWESGYHYIYNLLLSKTELKVTATLAEWTTVTASENVWF